MGYATESDFHFHVLEALRIQKGEALVVRFHPPLYAFLLAAFEIAVGDWFLAGRLMSLLGVVVVLISSYTLALALFGARTALGVLIVAATSQIFIAFGAMAATDIPFLALYSLALLALFYADSEGGDVRWLLVGLSVGAAILMRTNGIILAPVIALSLWSPRALRSRFRSFAFGLFGLGVLPILWFFYATITNSPLIPTGNHINLAMTFYSRDLGLAPHEFALWSIGRFDNFWDVLVYDPAQALRSYLRNFAVFIFVGSTSLISAPISLLLLPGLIARFFEKPPRFALIWLALTIAHILLVSLKSVEPRYYLFLVPVVGLGLGKTYELIANRLQNVSLRRWLSCVIATCVLLSFVGAVGQGTRQLYSGSRELAAAIPKIRSVVSGPEQIIIARKNHASIYSGATYRTIPQVDSLEELRQEILDLSAQDPVFLHFGQIEAKLRPQLSFLRKPENAPDWLVPLFSGTEEGGWTFYQFSKNH
jgi:4-amino-4-deoxy-L-arabinose transferase-like glycosyltransferase